MRACAGPRHAALPPPSLVADPKSWEARCTILAFCCCCAARGGGKEGHYQDQEAQPQRLSARLGNLFAVVRGGGGRGPSAAAAGALHG